MNKRKLVRFADYYPQDAEKVISNLAHLLDNGISGQITVSDFIDELRDAVNIAKKKRESKK